MAVPHASPSTPVFTPEECKALLALRRRYRLQPMCFDKREMARLHFVRWLVQTGRLSS